MLSQLTEYHKIASQNPADIAPFLKKLRQDSLSITHNEDIQQVLGIEPIFWNFLSAGDKSAKVVLDQVNYKPIAISNNIKSVTGLDLRIERPNAFNDFMSCLAPKHLLMLARAIESFARSEKSAKFKFYSSAICGLTVLPPDGTPHRLLIRGTHYAHNAGGCPQISLLTLDKINFMMKSEDAWMRLTYSEANDKMSFFSTADSFTADLFSPRELDVLNCIAQGMDSKMTAEKLYVSVETVVKHRKNMLAKSGLCDTTALLHICRSAGMLS